MRHDKPSCAVAAFLFSLVSCASSGRIGSVQAYRDAHARGDLAAEAALVAPGARTWYESKSGDGEPLTVGKSGRYAHWDEFFRSSSVLTGWSVDGDAVSAVVHETNDFYRLLDWEPAPYRMTWWLDSRGRITGVLIQSSPDKPKNRMTEFREWAKVHHLDELSYLMPGGHLDPTGDRAERWKAILTQWRSDAGLPPPPR